jgi:uncharacterized protein (DUF2141 family)
MLKIALNLSLVIAAMSVANAEIVTSCSGTDNQGNAISLQILQDNSEKEFSSSNPSSMSVELQTPTGPLHYTVLDSDVDTGDASLSAKSDDNGGISFKTEGAGVATSGTIGFLESKFKFVDCKAGTAAPLAW